MSSFDAKLEYLLTTVMNFKLTDPVPLALSKAFIITFDTFREIDPQDVFSFTTISTGSTTETKLHITLVKSIQRGVWYTQFLESTIAANWDDPLKWNATDYRKWCRNGVTPYLLSLTSVQPATASTSTAVTSIIGATQQQKDDDLSLIHIPSPRD